MSAISSIPFNPQEPGQLGKITGEPDWIYHANSAVSNSKLGVFMDDGPVYYKAEYIDKERTRPETTPMKLGKAIHAMIAESDSFLDQYAVWPGYTKRGTTDEISYNKTTKAWWDFCELNSDKVPLTREEYDGIQRSAQAVAAHPIASQLMSAPDVEFEVTWRVKIEIDGVEITVQCRTDIFSYGGCDLTKGKPFILDCKTQDKLGNGFHTDFRKKWKFYHYYRQSPFYSAILNTFQEGMVGFEQFFFAAVERKVPYQVLVSQQSERSFSLGFKEVFKGLTEMAECMKTGVWPGQPAEIQLLDFIDYEYDHLLQGQGL